MTNDEAIRILPDIKGSEWDKAIDLAIKALKAQLSKEDATSDCISRQDAIRIASGYCHQANIAKELKKLPSVQPAELDREDAQPEIMSDGTLHITVSVDVADIDRILLSQAGTHLGDLYYRDED